MKRVREAGIILLFLIILYTGINYIQQESPTGNVVYEHGSLNVFDGLDVNSLFNKTSGGIALVKQENIIERNFTAYNITALVSAFEGNSNKTSKVISKDGQKYELDKNDILNITFADALAAGDVVTIHSDDDDDRGIQVCRSNGNCNLTIRSFNSTHEAYNFTLIADIGDKFYVDDNKSVDIDAVLAFKKNTFFYNESSWNYPAHAEIFSGKIELPVLSVVHDVIANHSMNNQSVKYEYSADNITWVLLTNPLEKQLEKFWLKITFYSNGNFTPEVYGVSVNYSRCVRECFPEKIEIDKIAVISLMPNETAFVNASFTGLNIHPRGLELNKTLSVAEYNETNKSYEKKPAGRFVDIESDILNASFTLRMHYTDEELAANGVKEDSLKVYYYNESSGKWDALNSTIYANENYVEAALEHLSTYGLFGEGIDSGSSVPGSGSGGGGGSGGRGSSRRFVEESEIISTTSSTSTTSTTINAKVLDSQDETATTTLPLETIQDSASGGLFKAMTGGVVDFGRKIAKTPSLILALVVISLALAYMLIRFKKLKRKR